MPDDPTPRLGLAQPADTDFINSGPATIRDALGVLDEIAAVAIITVPRPAASVFGRFQRAADGTISFDTGTSWIEIARGPILTAYIVDGAVTLAKLAADVPLPPLASISAYAATVLPADGRWSWADGSLIDRTTYAAFFAAVGHAFNGGVDPGSNLVRLPDLRGRVPVGVDGLAGRLDALDALGNSGGEQKHASTQKETPWHTHSLSAVQTNTGGHTHPAGEISVASAPSNGSSASTINPINTTRGADGNFWQQSSNTPNGEPHHNMQPYQAVNYLVRVLGPTRITAP
jgi:microcystin-dependent protein